MGSLGGFEGRRECASADGLKLHYKKYKKTAVSAVFLLAKPDGVCILVMVSLGQVIDYK